jgi:hypothetical protein
MAKRSKIAAMTAAVRETSRNIACGKGVPGRFNPNRTVKFGTKTDKNDARGRTYRNED